MYPLCVCVYSTILQGFQKKMRYSCTSMHTTWDDEKKKMIGFFWNFRGMNQASRLPALIRKNRDSSADFIGITELRKVPFLMVS